MKNNPIKNRFHVKIPAIHPFYKNTKAKNKEAIEAFKYHDWIWVEDWVEQGVTDVYYAMGAIEPRTRKSILLDSIIIVSEAEFTNLFYKVEKFTISPSAYIKSLENWLIFIGDCYQHNFDKFLEMQKSEKYGAFAEYKQIEYLPLSTLIQSIAQLEYIFAYMKDPMPFEFMARRTKYDCYQFENIEAEKYISKLEELLIFVCHIYQTNHDRFFKMYVEKENKYYYRLATVQGTRYRFEVQHISELCNEIFTFTLRTDEYDELFKQLKDNQTKKNKEKNV
ncbi:hypothetical protein [Bacillus sp. NPDC094106]|uniref:hypothetical protein n=1 Tax=Bacillus sp. NPDC094106 TaxID=3363949 RepID=UPI003806D4AA